MNDNVFIEMNLWHNNISPGTAEVIVIYPSVSLIENRQEQEASQRILYL